MSIMALLQKDVAAFKPYYVTGVHNVLCTLCGLEQADFRKGIHTIPEKISISENEFSEDIIYKVNKTLSGYIKLFEVYNLTIFDFSYYQCKEPDIENITEWIKDTVARTERVQPKMHSTSSYLLLWDILLAEKIGDKVLVGLLLDLLKIHFQQLRGSL